MKEKYLVINAGSSSLKFSLYEMPEYNEIVNGIVERIGYKDSSCTIKYNGEKFIKQKLASNHTDAVKVMISELIENKLIDSIEEIKGVGHRVLHGGEVYSDSILIDDEVINNIEALTKLGPLHHPGELAGIYSMKQILPGVPQVAVWDTAFHQTIDKVNYMYAVPQEWYEKYKVRKYGFHGTSHKYITETMKNKLNKEDVNLIICHIGSGASISVICDGKCIDTSMGFTPLAGTMMGTRSGDIDASIIPYIMEEQNKTIDEVMNDLNKHSGLLGVSKISSDFRDIEIGMDNQDKNAILAYNMCKKSIIDYIGKYYFELKGKVDAIVFTAGVGENVIRIREDIINDIGQTINVRLNKEANDNIGKSKQKQEGIITTDDSNIKVFVIPTDEEIMILKDTYKIINNLENKYIESNQKIFKK